MRDQLLHSHQQFLLRQERDLKKGLNTREFTISLIQCYSESMIKALQIIGEDKYILQVQTEADRCCLSIDPGFKPKLRLIHSKTEHSSTRPLSTDTAGKELLAAQKAHG